MENAIETMGVHAEVITPDDGGHYFFGYYDLQPFDSTGRYHLCHKAPFEDRIPSPEDVCELGVIDLETHEFIRYAETTAWNFQQGALLRWYKDDNHILFNVYEDGAYRCCILNIKTGEKRILPMAVADTTKDCKFAVCVNFSRIYNFRPGYGYAGIEDPYFKVKAPKEDGVFLMDLETGSVKQILTYETLRDTFFEEPCSNGKLLVNHINFNTDGTHFAMLFRNFPEKGMYWKTQLLTSDLEGNLYCLANFSFQSHYNWKNENELLIFGSNAKNAPGNPELALYLYENRTPNVQKLPEPNPNLDMHCLYSPNRRYIIGDGYPDENGYRPIYFIDTENPTVKNHRYLGKYYSTTRTKPTVEYRCDLHARFDRTGRYISFDSNHIGKRCICLIDMQKLDGYVY